MTDPKPKIFGFVNAGWGTEYLAVVAIAEDGTYLAEHCSSSERWAMHDIGVTSTRNHGLYAKHYPDGFEVVWVTEHEIKDHPNAAFDAALGRANAIAVAAGIPE